MAAELMTFAAGVLTGIALCALVRWLRRNWLWP